MKLSVIIPIYNVEKFLKECLDSVINQTFIDFELLLINDGSKDNSGQICDEYAQKDNRIKVFHQDNSGVSSTRNFGIKQSRGDWICFVDSDDVLLPDYLSDLIKGCDNNDFVISGITVLETTDNTKKEVSARIEYKSASIDDVDILETIPILCLASPISKLFKRTIIEANEIQFNKDVNIGEDYIFVLEYIKQIKYFHINAKSNYIYFRRHGSLSTTYNSFEEEVLAESLLFERTLDVFGSLNYHIDIIDRYYIAEFKKHAYRILFSLYNNKCSKYNKRKRIFLVESLSEEQLHRLKRMFSFNGRKGVIISKLFNKNIFWFSDILFKYSVNRLL